MLPEKIEESESSKRSRKRSSSISPEELMRKVEDEAVLPRVIEKPVETSRLTAPPGFIRGLLHFGRLFTVTFVGALWWLVLSMVRYLWRHPVHAAFSAVLLGVAALLLITGSQMHDQLILSQISDETVDRIIDASRFTRNYQSEAVGRLGAREFLRVGGPRWTQREGVRAVLFHARRSGLSLEDQAVLLATVEIESGFNPMARAATTSACGLFQFVRETGRNFGLAPENCMNPWLNAQAGVQHYLYTYDIRVRRHVENLSGTEKMFKTFEHSYYLHHDGPYSSNPSAELKATVLNGVGFLFKVHAELEREESLKQKAPTFTQRFADNVWDHVMPVMASLKRGAVEVPEAFAATAKNDA